MDQCRPKLTISSPPLPSLCRRRRCDAPRAPPAPRPALPYARCALYLVFLSLRAPPLGAASAPRPQAQRSPPQTRIHPHPHPPNPPSHPTVRHRTAPLHPASTHLALLDTTVILPLPSVPSGLCLCPFKRRAPAPTPRRGLPSCPAPPFCRRPVEFHISACAPCLTSGPQPTPLIALFTSEKLWSPSLPIARRLPAAPTPFFTSLFFRRARPRRRPLVTMPTQKPVHSARWRKRALLTVLLCDQMCEQAGRHRRRHPPTSRNGPLFTATRSPRRAPA